MDKNAIKKYAIWARRELIERVAQRAAMYGITEKDHGDPEAESVDGRLLSPVEKRQRQALIQKIAEKGYQQVIEEVAYTWFNRFAALRFMEVNGYLPTHIRVFTNDANEFKPQILSEAIHLELEGLNRNRVYELENENKREELFKYLLTVQCNALNEILPGMFQKIEDYTELLLPDNLLRQGSVIEQMISMIPEADWTDQVQIIGWLYQYYNTEPKDKVFADLKKNIKITKENIPAATQLFTPDWIVHYMVENSLGRLWLEGHPNDALKSQWKYYLDEAEQEPEVQAQLDEIRKEHATLKPEEIKVIDPCMGSGHILCVLFDVLVQIYEDYGYSAREAAVSIVENNLWGLDIDDRAAQLAYFAVMMKARQYDRRFFHRGIQLHVYSIAESNNLDPHFIEYFVNERTELKSAIDVLVKGFHDAKEYGSLIRMDSCNYDVLLSRLKEIKNEPNPNAYSIQAIETLTPIFNLAHALSQKYHVFCTNPPYMGNNGMGKRLTAFVKEEYPTSKSDLFACFITRGIEMIQKNGYISMITMESWMFLSSFEKMRSEMLTKSTLTSLVHMPYLGKGGTSLGINFGTAAFVIAKRRSENYKGSFDYIRYYEINEKGVPFEFPVKNERFRTSTLSNFFKIPGAPIAYWFTEQVFSLFENENSFANISETKSGLSTTDNNRFVRTWTEVNFNSIGFNYEHLEDTEDCKYRFIPHQKGGEYRKWYGNLDYVVDWYNNGAAIRKAAEGATGGRIVGSEYYLKEGLTWTDLTSTGKISVRYAEKGSIFNSSGPMCFCFDHNDQNIVLGYMNSVVAREFLKLLAPTFHFNGGPISKLPFVAPGIYRDRIDFLVSQNVEIAREDWNLFEGSWNYSKNPLVRNVQTIEDAFLKWAAECEYRFSTVKKNEEELNILFSKLYGLERELIPDVEEDDIKIRRADIQRDIRRLISYSVGCMFGRYSLDKQGLIYAGGNWDEFQYSTFPADEDGIIPICDDEYFDNDIVKRFEDFVKTVYGENTLEENLNYIASALGGKGSARSILRTYFSTEFFTDHCSIYSVASSGKRPIYWLFDSGKKNGFKCLIYMHRYQPDTIARIRTDYIHEQQSRYRTAIADLEQRVSGASTSERVKLNKQLTKLRDQAEELRVYEEKIHHLADQMIKINLDDGVKVNYAKFQDVLAPIK